MFSDMTTPTSRRRTRSHCTEIIKAKQVLQESCQSVVVDMDRLNRLLIRVVAQTPFYGVHKLERLYSHFSHCIYKHRNDYNKTDLIQVILKKKIYYYFSTELCPERNYIIIFNPFKS